MYTAGKRLDGYEHALQRGELELARADLDGEQHLGVVPRRRAAVARAPAREAPNGHLRRQQPLHDRGMHALQGEHSAVGLVDGDERPPQRVMLPVDLIVRGSGEVSA